MLPFLVVGAGIYAGLRFSIWVLLPLSLLGAGAYMLAAGASGNIGTVLFPVIAIQAGYMLGLTARPTYDQLLARLNIDLSGRHL